ncbi:MAG: YeeE/YedE thiosulfate transporter family protein [candidate division KSB1 bacterium]|nr:YeeE/YedE thiosulfate transporter family protein [candidate division KSB1 bacterium]
MFAPLFKYDYFGVEVSYIIAFIIGILFGYTLERAGFSSSRKLALQFYLRDMTVLKVMFTGIVVAMLGILYLNLADVLDMSLIYINPTYIWPQMLGGLIMGVGFVIGGYCPGTSLVASTVGKLDGMMYVLGALFGMFIYGEIFPAIKSIAESGYMGEVTLSDWLHLRPGLIAFFIVIMALAMFGFAEWAEKRFGEKKPLSENTPSTTASTPQSMEEKIA